jgi:TRAP-type uncharacterized transport system substrate-binding protein
MPQRKDKPRKLRPTGRWETLALFGGSALLLVGGFWLALQFVQPAPPQQISMAAGQPGGAYLRYAERYRRALAEHGIELKLLETNGSVENLSLLLRKDDPVDIALVQGGIATDAQRRQLSGLGSMFYEPVWLLTPDEAPTRALNTLAGLRLGVGAEGSGTHKLVMRLLALNGINADNATLVAESSQVLAQALIERELDLMFAVGAPDAPLLRRLLDNDDIRLQPLPRADAYARINRSLTRLVLPEGVLSPAADRPDEDLPLVAATANLVARPELHPALVDLLIQAANAVHGTGSLLAPPGTFPTPQHSDFTMNADAERHYEHGPPFLQRYLPFWAATWVDRTKVMLLPLVALAFPLIKILPPVYAWRVRRRILRWYVQLRRIDLEIETGEVGEDDVPPLYARLEQIESDAAQIDVPLGYSDQLYNLRLHIRLLEQKLERIATDT